MSNIKKFFDDYLFNLIDGLNSVDKKKLNKAVNLFTQKIKQNRNIFVCGNGGSAAIANHYICDFLKYFRQHTRLKPKIYSLSTNIETVTAISNDMNYDKIFSYQAESLCQKQDLVIIISSSGNSKNIKNLLKFTKKNKIKTIGFSGFNGGFLSKNSDISININKLNYGISEDSHHILMHIILQFMILQISKKNLLK